MFILSAVLLIPESVIHGYSLWRDSVTFNTGEQGAGASLCASFNTETQGIPQGVPSRVSSGILQGVPSRVSLDVHPWVFVGVPVHPWVYSLVVYVRYRACVHSPVAGFNTFDGESSHRWEGFSGCLISPF